MTNRWPKRKKVPEVEEIQEPTGRHALICGGSRNNLRTADRTDEDETPEEE